VGNFDKLPGKFTFFEALVKNSAKYFWGTPHPAVVRCLTFETLLESENKSLAKRLDTLKDNSFGATSCPVAGR